MAKTVQAQCGHCQKTFRLRKDQLNREVLCPHCRTITKISPQSEAGAKAARALRAGKAERGSGGAKKPSTIRRPIKLQGGIRNRSVAIVWAVLLGMGLIAAVITMLFVFGNRNAGTEGVPASPTPPTPIAVGPGPRPHTSTVPTASPGDDALQGPPPAGTSAAPGPASPGTSVGQGTGVGPDTARRPEAPEVEVHIVRPLPGYADDTCTYAVGRVTNRGHQTIAALRISVPLMESKDEPAVGTAVADILNLPPGHTAPVVAELRHPAGVRPMAWASGQVEFEPEGVPTQLPPLEVVGAVAMPSPNDVELSGLIRIDVKNHGEVEIKAMLITALLMDSKGKIVGAVKTGATKTIQPGATEEVTVQWENCSSTLVKAVDAWAQPFYYKQPSD